MNMLIEVRGMLQIVVMASVIVFIAMVIDLISGLQKAKQRGEVRTSYGLSRSLSKFIQYEGGILIGAGIDMLIHYSHLKGLFGLTVLDNVPVITCLIGVFLLITEFLSIREKADEKTRKNFSTTAELLQTLFSKEELKEMIKNRLENNKDA